jgi:hypothetical protein
MLGDIAGRDDSFCNGNVVVGNEYKLKGNISVELEFSSKILKKTKYLQIIGRVRIHIDNISHAIDQLNNHFGNIVSRS